MEKMQAVRGMNDLLPKNSYHYDIVLYTLQNILLSYGYDRIRTPIVEKTPVFKRAIGEVTDIVEKEMYSWLDGKEYLSLRPEGTASIVRAMIEHNLPRESIQKVFYHGPMYRHERPQKGRYREFFQFGAEVFGDSSIACDVEIIEICKTIIEHFGINATLQLNTLGILSDREAYNQDLVKYFTAHKQQLDKDSLARLHTNPLRILDSKDPDMRAIIDKAPQLIHFINKESKERYEKLQHMLNELNIPFQINPTLVRGLDYYNDIVFEWISDDLGAQSTICAGGRYDELVSIMGGQATPGVGFAMGLERLLLLIQSKISNPYHFYIISNTTATNNVALQTAKMLREYFTGIIVYNDISDKSFKNKFKKADKKNARYALIIGEQELQTKSIIFKYLQTQEEQQTLALDQLIPFIKSRQLL